jgi:hypothetical protein
MKKERGKYQNAASKVFVRFLGKRENRLPVKVMKRWTQGV